MNFWMSYICDVSHHLNYFLLKAECFHILCFRSQLYQYSSSHHPRSYTQVPFEAEGFHFLVVRRVTARIFIIPSPSPQSFSKLKVSIFLVSGVNAVQQPLPLQQGSNFFLKEEFIFSSKQNTSQRNNFFLPPWHSVQPMKSQRTHLHVSRFLHM